jgi:hypothetical protein
MWEALVLDGQVLALQEGSAVGWMAKESFISFWQGKVFSHRQSIQTTSEASPLSYSVCTEHKMAGPGNKPLISV